MIVIAKYIKFVALVALASVSASCGEFTRQGTAPVIVVVDRLSVEDDQGTLHSDVLTEGSVVNDMAEVRLRLILKDPGDSGAAASPTPLNSVTITRYHVEYRRTDGRNVQGVDVPFAFDSGLTFTISAGQSQSAVFQIVRNTAKAEAPLKALANNGEILSTIAYVTFYGHDQAGNDVSANASIGIDFANFADADKK
jgi:hypothetical protein